MSTLCWLKPRIWQAILQSLSTLQLVFQITTFGSQTTPPRGKFRSPDSRGTGAHGLHRDTTNGLATIGTLVLEWTHLSDLTGNQTFADLTQHAESYLLNPEPPSSQPFPGLVGTNVALNNGSFLDAYGGWIGGDDSFYEYLIKMYVYDSSRFGFYKDRWTLAADSSIEYLASHPSSRTDLTFVAVFNGTQLVYESEHRKWTVRSNY